MKMTLGILLSLCFVVVICIHPAVSSRVVNISDAWLLSDSESPVFYRHFRDRVTWSEAEAICQFHHSVLATVRNTGEFDRTRALLQELDWSTPVWVGLRRVLGQPMFKWSTPAGATLLPSDGYWYEAPNTLTPRALCVMVDPAADFRWRAVDCGSSTELFSFLCQIPVPTWARSEHGGCLSPRWPSTEVTVQYLPQTRALEMTADCGLRGTKRIACKQHSNVDIQHMERKLQCPSDVTSSSSESATPPRPPTRHRRDTKPSTMSTPDSSNITHTSNAGVNTEGVTTAHPSPAPDTIAPRTETPSHIVSSSLPTPVNTEDAIIVTTGIKASPSQHTTTQEDITKVTEKVKFIEPNDIKITSSIPIKATEDNYQNIVSTVVSGSSTTPQSTVLVDIINVSPQQKSTENTLKTEVITPAKNTAETISETVTAMQKTDADITSNHPADLYSKSFTTTTAPAETTQYEATAFTTMTPHPPTVKPSLSPVQNMQPMTHHQVVPGKPRNIASSVTHPNAHPPMVVSHTMTEGVPRNVPIVHPHSSVMQHPVMMAEGNPRIVGSGDIHRSAEDHVTSRRRQFLPASLRGLPPTPGVTHPQPSSPQHFVHEPQQETANKEAMKTELTEEEEEDDDISTTVDSLNSQTEEEIMEADERRLHSRRAGGQPRQAISQTRNLYPFLLNRMLG